MGGFVCVYSVCVPFLNMSHCCFLDVLPLYDRYPQNPYMTQEESNRLTMLGRDDESMRITADLVGGNEK